MALGSSALAVVLLITALTFHRYDRGRAPSPLEQALLAYGQHEPVAVLGVIDLRSLLGPRLERPLVSVARGGETGEVPFSDENQIRRLILGQNDVAPAPASFGPALDEMLQHVGAELLVVSPSAKAASYPEGWRPDGRWCAVAVTGAVVLYATGAALAATPGARC